MHWRPYFYHLPLARLKHSSVALVLNQTGFSQLRLWVPWWPLLEKMDLFYHKFQSCAISTIFSICATHLTFEQKRVTSSHLGSNNREGPVWWILNYFDNILIIIPDFMLQKNILDVKSYLNRWLDYFHTPKLPTMTERRIMQLQLDREQRPGGACISKFLFWTFFF